MVVFISISVAVTVLVQVICLRTRGECGGGQIYNSDGRRTIEMTSFRWELNKHITQLVSVCVHCTTVSACTDEAGQVVTDETQKASQISRKCRTL